MLILASESPRRKELLAQTVEKFEIRSADVEEITAAADPFLVPEINARTKAGRVAQANPGALVIGADTVIIFENRVIGKPRDIDDAARILAEFSGKIHYTVTGVSLRRTGNEPVDISFREISEVKFKTLDSTVIASYLNKVNVLDKAGAYALQEHGDMIIEYFTGEENNIIGLPTSKLKKLLQELL